jgi:hypothetical protein
MLCRRLLMLAACSALSGCAYVHIAAGPGTSGAQPPAGQGGQAAPRTVVMTATAAPDAGRPVRQPSAPWQPRVSAQGGTPHALHHHTHYRYHHHGWLRLRYPTHPGLTPHHDEGRVTTGFMTGSQFCAPTAVIGLPADVTALCHWALPG